MMNESRTFVALAKPTAGSRYTLSSFPVMEGAKATVEIAKARLLTWLSSTGHQDDAEDIADSRTVYIRALSEVDLGELGFRASR